MSYLLRVAPLLAVAGPAWAGLLGTSVAVDFAGPGCGLTATVAHPAVEFPAAGPGLCMAGPTPRLDIDVRDTSVRVDWTAEADYGFGGGTFPMFTFSNLNPTCPNGTIGWITGLSSVTTNMETDEWVPSQVSFSAHQLVILADPTALGGDNPNLVRTHPGDFIEVGLQFTCVNPHIVLSGTCPSPVSVAATGFTPGGSVAVIRSNAPGSFVVPSGSCAGLNLSLGAPGIGIVTTVTASPSGAISWSGSVGPTYCSKWFQFVDMATCQPSNIDQF
ncbi:MAG TPA: hypothetical protein PKA64_03890 [Myxococcota bacterium]|nr:hypothetical protein [Myxococcota bacterium]